VVRRIAVAAMAAAVGLGATARQAYSHPLHTTLTEVTVRSDGTVQIVLRAFVDDFSAAVTGRVPPRGAVIPTPPDSAAARYLAQTVVLTDGSRRRAPLVLTNTRRTDDLLWITLRVPGLRSLAGARLTNRVLFDRWPDQVNIVQTSVGTGRRTLLFTRREGDVAKAL